MKKLEVEITVDTKDFSDTVQKALGVMESIMPIKPIKNIKVLIGFNTKKGNRFEVGENIADSVLTTKEIKVLLEMEAIEVETE